MCVSLTNVVGACVLGLKPGGNCARICTSGGIKTKEASLRTWKSKGKQILCIRGDRSSFDNHILAIRLGTMSQSSKLEVVLLIIWAWQKREGTMPNP